MSAFIGSIVLNVADSRRAASFWGRALGYVPQENNPDFLLPQHGDGGVRLHLDEDDQTHLDMWVECDESELESEVERLVSLGAKRVDWTYSEGADHVVLADTEGNLFCVVPTGRGKPQSG
jgi:hypothetical protein